MIAAVPVISKKREFISGNKIRKLSRSRGAKFIAIGIMNTAFGYFVFAVLYLATADHRLSIVVATIVGVIFNFFTTGRIVFQSTSNALIFRFVGGYALSLGVNLLLLEIPIRLGANALLAQVLCLPPVVGLTYFVNARLVFRNAPR